MGGSRGLGGLWRKFCRPQRRRYDNPHCVSVGEITFSRLAAGRIACCSTPLESLFAICHCSSSSRSSITPVSTFIGHVRCLGPPGDSFPCPSKPSSLPLRSQLRLRKQTLCAGEDSRGSILTVFSDSRTNSTPPLPGVALEDRPTRPHLPSWHRHRNS
jgi:hypothetical protein